MTLLKEFGYQAWKGLVITQRDFISFVNKVIACGLGNIIDKQTITLRKICLWRKTLGSYLICCSQ